MPPKMRRLHDLDLRGQTAYAAVMLTVAALYHFSRFSDPAALRPQIAAHDLAHIGLGQFAAELHELR